MSKYILALATGCGLLGVTPAAADVSGCTVLLCLASPQGWASIPECVAPVQSFARAQKKTKSIAPHCPERDTGVSSSLVAGERVYTLTLPDGTQQHVAVPAQARRGDAVP
jgi:hypothetical protein